MSRRIWRIESLGAMSVLMASVCLAENVLYHVTPIGKLPGALGSQARDVSDVGQVVGIADFRDGVNEAWLWDPHAGLLGLGQLPGGRNVSVPTAINELGWIVGVANSENGTEAFLWTPEEGMQGLGDLPKGGFYSWARGINNHNEITGVGKTKTALGDSKHQEAFLWNARDGMWSLGEWPGGQQISVAVDINDASQVIGWSVRFTWPEPFLWDRENGMRPIQDLPGGAKLQYAEAINNLGQVAGLTRYQGITQACIWSEQDGLTPLGTLGGDDPYSVALDINDRGEVIGFARADSNAPLVVFISDREHGMRAIEDLIDAGWRVEDGGIRTTALNNRGQIVGFARDSDDAVLLTPFVLGDMNCDGTVDNADVAGFLLTLLDFEEYQGRYPDCHGDWAADTNQDGTVNPQDVEAFVGLLLK